MPSEPGSWTRHLIDEFDRYSAELMSFENGRYFCPRTGNSISIQERSVVRDEVIANATTNPRSLAYQMLRCSVSDEHGATPCPTCDAAVRLAWGASLTRRALGLPVSDDLEPASDAQPH